MTPQTWFLGIAATVAGAALIGLGRLAFGNPPIYRYVAWSLAKIMAWAVSIYLAYCFGFFAAGAKLPEPFSPALVFTGSAAFCFVLLLLTLVSDEVEKRAKASEQHRG